MNDYIIIGILLAIALLVVATKKRKKSKENPKPQVRIEGDPKFVADIGAVLNLAGGWAAIPSTTKIVQSTTRNGGALPGGVTTLKIYDRIEILASALHHEDEHHRNKYWDASECGPYEINQELIANKRQADFLASLNSPNKYVQDYIPYLRGLDGKHFDACINLT